MSAVTKVAIAVVESAGKFLVGVRSDDAVLAGKHEFPGGKCETDETPKSCAVRECREETGLLVVPREQLKTLTHQYDHGTIELHFWRCSLSPDLADCATPKPGFQWISQAVLSGLDFPDANADVVAMLCQPS